MLVLQEEVNAEFLLCEVFLVFLITTVIPPVMQVSCCTFPRLVDRKCRSSVAGARSNVAVEDDVDI
jgi:hypothetical protein